MSSEVTKVTFEDGTVFERVSGEWTHVKGTRPDKGGYKKFILDDISATKPHLLRERFEDMRVW